MYFAYFIIAATAVFRLARADFMVYTVPPIPTEQIPRFTDPAEVSRSTIPLFHSLYHPIYYPFYQIFYYSLHILLLSLTQPRPPAGPSASSTRGTKPTPRTPTPLAHPIDHPHPPPPKKSRPLCAPHQITPSPQTSRSPIQPRHFSRGRTGTLRCRAAQGRSKNGR